MSTEHTSNNLYRTPDKAIIAGVCAGICERFGFAVWPVRILVVIASLLGILFVPFVYLAAWLVLDKKAKPQATLDTDSAKWRSR